MPPSSKDSQVNVRFSEVTDAQLIAAAKKLGTTKSALVRHLTETFLSELSKSGSMALDLDWKKHLGAADARTAWGEAKMPVAAETKETSRIAELPSVSLKYPKGTRRPKSS
jgi:predicted DNA-binding protein